MKYVKDFVPLSQGITNNSTTGDHIFEEVFGMTLEYIYLTANLCGLLVSFITRPSEGV